MKINASPRFAAAVDLGSAASAPQIMAKPSQTIGDQVNIKSDRLIVCQNLQERETVLTPEQKAAIKKHLQAMRTTFSHFSEPLDKAGRSKYYTEYAISANSMDKILEDTLVTPERRRRFEYRDGGIVHRAFRNRSQADDAKQFDVVLQEFEQRIDEAEKPPISKETAQIIRNELQIMLDQLMLARARTAKPEHITKFNNAVKEVKTLLNIQSGSGEYLVFKLPKKTFLDNGIFDGFDFSDISFKGPEGETPRIEHISFINCNLNHFDLKQVAPTYTYNRDGSTRHFVPDTSLIGCTLKGTDFDGVTLYSSKLLSTDFTQGQNTDKLCIRPGTGWVRVRLDEGTKLPKHLMQGENVLCFNFPGRIDLPKPEMPFSKMPDYWGDRQRDWERQQSLVEQKRLAKQWSGTEQQRLSEQPIVRPDSKPFFGWLGQAIKYVIKF